MIKPCNCGSGKLRFELRDAAGIFCRFVCNDCYDRVKASYNPAIFKSQTYAAYGTEDALEAADYENEGFPG